MLIANQAKNPPTVARFTSQLNTTADVSLRLIYANSAKEDWGILVIRRLCTLIESTYAKEDGNQWQATCCTSRENEWRLTTETEALGGIRKSKLYGPIMTLTIKDARSTV